MHRKFTTPLSRSRTGDRRHQEVAHKVQFSGASGGLPRTEAVLVARERSDRSDAAGLRSGPQRHVGDPRATPLPAADVRELDDSAKNQWSPSVPVAAASVGVRPLRVANAQSTA